MKIVSWKRKVGFLIYLVMPAVFLVVLAKTVFAADTANPVRIFEDIKGHWAEKQIEDWLDKNILTIPQDRTFRPDADITRAEFFTLLNKSFGFSNESPISYSDVSLEDWYYGEIAKAKAAGYVSGYPDGTIKPNDKITRQEVALTFYQLLRLEDSVTLSALDCFKDKDEIPAWSRPAVSALVSGKYMSGYPDGNYSPTRNLTRAEAVVLSVNALGTFYNTPGIYGPSKDKQIISGNLTIAAGGITLRNIQINGNLYLTAGIGEGSVTLEKVTVQGKTVVNGGGENSIILKDSSLGEVIVNKKDGKVRVVAQGNTRITLVRVESGASLEEEGIIGDGFGNITIYLVQGEEVELAGSFETISLQSPGTVLKIAEGSVSSLQISQEAAGAKVEIADQAQVTGLEINAPATVSGSGKIERAIIQANNVVIEQRPVWFRLAENVEFAIIAGEKITPWTNKNYSSDSTGRLDTTAPIFAPTYPQITDLSFTSVNLLIKADEQGRAYYVVLPAASPAPNAVQVVAGLDGNDQPATLSGNFSFPANTEVVESITGLTSATDYKIYLTAKDGANNLTALKIISLVTEAPPTDDLFPEVAFTFTGLDHILLGEEVQFSATAKITADQFFDPHTAKIRFAIGLKRNGIGFPNFLVNYMEEGEEWTDFTTDEDGRAYFGLKNGLLPAALERLISESGLTIYFKTIFSEAGNYTLTLSLIDLNDNDTTLGQTSEKSFAVINPVAEVGNKEELITALRDEKITMINLTDNFSTAETILINRPVTLNGKGKTLTFQGDGEGWQGNYIFQVEQTGGVILKDLKLAGGDGALFLNGAAVVLGGTLDVSGNEFGGIKLGKENGAEMDPSLTLEEVDFINSTESYFSPTLWEEEGTSSNVINFKGTKLARNSQIRYYLKADNAKSPVTEIREKDEGDIILEIDNEARTIKIVRGKEVRELKPLFISIDGSTQSYKFTDSVGNLLPQDANIANNFQLIVRAEDGNTEASYRFIVVS
ncbi:MAG TPA: hypothetical protein GXX38_08260 [Clostridia bacterium]|nr:hypothetical protein [Clostridia bacterium]